MKYVGIDLHKKTISGCVVVKERGKKKIAARKRLECRDEAGIQSWFSGLGKFEVVVEATASYEWFVKLVEPFPEPLGLAPRGRPASPGFARRGGDRSAARPRRRRHHRAVRGDGDGLPASSAPRRHHAGDGDSARARARRSRHHERPTCPPPGA